MNRGLGAGLLLLILAAATQAADLPAIPCGGGQPAYPAVDAEPQITIVNGDELGAWTPPACTGWQAGRIGFVVVTAARFRHAGDIDALLLRFGAVSQYTTIRYWSPGAREWRPFAFEASALQDEDARHRRPDFTVPEFAPGGPRYFWQRMATELSFPLPATVSLVNRIDVLESSADRLVVSVANEPASVAIVLSLNRGDIRVLYFFEREAAERDVWRYFTLASFKGLAATSPEAFFHNSARAIFSYSAGLPAEVPEAP